MTYIFILLAAIFNAVMDKTKDTIQFNSSAFRNLNPKFWNDEVSESVFILGTKYKPNAWHISKSCMIFCFAFAIIFYKPFINYIDFCVIGAIWILTFNLFYNHIFKRS